MVQILKPQMRNYQADQTEAIRQQQITQNISEVSDLVAGVANVYNAFQEGAEAKQKQAEEAEMKVINTEIGSKAANEVLRLNVTNVQEKGIDVSTPEYQAAFEQEATKIYQPYIDSVKTEKGKEFLQTQLRQTVDSINRSNIDTIGKFQKSAQAQQAAQDLSESMQTDAVEFGKLGDWDAFVEESEASSTALVDYMESQGTPRELAEAQVDYKKAENYLLGLAMSNPEEALGLIYVQDRGGELAQLSGSAYDVAQTAYIKDLEAQKQQLVEEQKQYKKDTPNYRSYDKKIAEIDEQISAPEKQVEKIVRAQLAKKIVPVAQEALKKQEAEQQKNAHEGVMGLYTTTLSPDIRESTNAGVEIDSLDKETVFKQLGVRDLKQYNKLNSAYDVFKKSQEDINNRAPKFNTTFKATDTAVQKLKKLFTADDRTDVEVLEDAFLFLADAGNMEVSDSQYDTIKNVVYAGVRDKVWGSEIANVINNSDRYYPDLGFMETYWADDAKDGGLVSGYKNMSKTSKDKVKQFMNVELEKMYSNSLYMIDQALRLPENERRGAFDKITNYIVDEKKRIFGQAVADYGINLDVLRKERDTKGYAYTRIGFRTVEYKGDLDNGTPIFEDVDDKSEIKLLRERLMNQLGKTDKKDE